MQKGKSNEVVPSDTSKSKQQTIKKSDKRSYDKKKTLGQGLLDVALLASNVAILKAVVKAGPSYEYFVSMIVFIALSLFAIIVVAILLLIIGTTEYINNIRKNHWKDL